MNPPSTSAAPVAAPIDAPAVADRLGRPLRDLRISVIDRCNLRCPYCMPEEHYPEHYEFFTRDERLSYAEIERVARSFVRLGVTKLRITGGEPLLRKDLPELVSMLAGIPGVEDLALTTNGILLARQAEALAAAGLHRVTVSLDSLNPEVFAEMSGGRGDPGTVVKGIEAALARGLTPVKINTVVKRGVNDACVDELVARFRHTGVIIRFIEFMDVGTRNHWSREQVVPSAELLERIGERWPLTSVEENYRGEVATRYRFDDGGGEIGFISSVTDPFCGDCTRARLSANGELYTCLFAGKGADLRGMMRDGVSDQDLETHIADLWGQRRNRYSEQRAGIEHPLRKVEMYQVGG